MSIFISKNFRFSEFVCPCKNKDCKKDKLPNPQLVNLLQKLRDKINVPIYITSGLRCIAYNKSIDGYFNSAHLFGKAVDIYTKNINLIKLAKEARDIGFSRIGIYKRYIHLDTIRPYPSASWIRDLKGKYHYFKTLEDTILFMEEKL